MATYINDRDLQEKKKKEEQKYPRPLRESGKPVAGGLNLQKRVEDAIARQQATGPGQEPYQGAMDTSGHAAAVGGFLKRGANQINQSLNNVFSVGAFKRDLGGLKNDLTRVEPYRTDAQGMGRNPDGSIVATSNQGTSPSPVQPVRQTRGVKQMQPLDSHAQSNPNFIRGGGLVGDNMQGAQFPVKEGGETITVPQGSLSNYLADPNRPTAGRGSFNDGPAANAAVNNWYDERMAKLKGTIQKNDTEYQKQVARAKEINAQGPVVSAIQPWQKDRIALQQAKEGVAAQGKIDTAVAQQAANAEKYKADSQLKGTMYTADAKAGPEWKPIDVPTGEIDPETLKQTTKKGFYRQGADGSIEYKGMDQVIPLEQNYPEYSAQIKTAREAGYGEEEISAMIQKLRRQPAQAG
jgi:hypothetical protein